MVAARKLALDYPQTVRDGVAQARAILARGYRPHNDVGFVLDVVRSYGNGKYAWPEGARLPRPLEEAPARPRPPQPEMPEAPPSSEDLARTLAFLLKAEGLRREDLARLPLTTLQDVHGRVLGCSPRTVHRRPPGCGGCWRRRMPEGALSAGRPFRRGSMGQ